MYKYLVYLFFKSVRFDTFNNLLIVIHFKNADRTVFKGKKTDDPVGEHFF